jgi:energy-coupling factor transporter ATP-binding protein EcfA2
MFRSLTLTDFQSHQSSHLELGPFTVIVGSSSSGKSAVVRALRLVADNARGTSYVRQGAASCRVALELAGSEPVLDASTVVTVERGKSVSAYTLRVAGMHDEPLLFTKCASSVPEAVAAALELGESALWVAGQFDRPYLLDETGAEVARVLGKLTNVNMIYTAVRETNRRASEARRSHAAKASELAVAVTELSRYASLPDRLAAGREAESALARADALASRRDALARQIADLGDALTRARTARVTVRSVPDPSRMVELSVGRVAIANRLSELRNAQSRCSIVTVGLRPVPDIETFDTLLARRARLRLAIGSVVESGEAKDRVRTQLRDAGAAAEAACKQFVEALESAGNCPLCGANSGSAQVENVL